MNDIISLNLEDQIGLLETKKISSYELTTLYLENIKENKDLNCFISVNEDALEQAKVELEKQKLQADTASDAAELQLKNKELEIKETGQLIDMLKSTGQSKSREQQSQLNRESKEAIKEAILEGIIANEHKPAFDFMVKKGKEMGLGN